MRHSPRPAADLGPIADDRLGADAATDDDPFPPRDGRPRVAVTLGTVNHHQVAVLRALIDGAVAAGAHVVALGADPELVGEVPPGVSVHAYVPMSVLLPASDLVAFHAGSGTMLAALAAGTPMIIVPLAADQPDNADRCLAAGVARVLTPGRPRRRRRRRCRERRRQRANLATPGARGGRRGRGHAGPRRGGRSDRIDRARCGVRAPGRTLGT